MKSYANICTGWCVFRRALWIRWFAVLVGFYSAGAEEPRIRAIEQRGAELLIRVTVPPGIARVVLEGCRRNDLKAWIPKATTRVVPSETEITFTLPADASMEFYRARVDLEDPLPAAWYRGRTNFPGEPASDPTLIRAGIEDVAAPENSPTVDGGGGGAARSVVESDIWAMRGTTLYFFNELRGLQVIDVANPDAPSVRGTFRLPGSGEQMYLAGANHVVLLAHDPCRQWATDAESAVWILDTTASPPVEVARLPLIGRIIESRLVGTALYVATESWESVNDGSGSWRSGTRLAAFDVSNPGKPVGRGTLWFPGSGNVVAATDDFFFISVTDYSKAWPWKSDLEVVDITAPDGTLATWARIPLAGRVHDKFKIDVHEDVLRVVVEAVESPDAWRFVTVLETYRLSDPRSASPLPIARLDRLELARGERLFATRFDGARGYIVTFERVDPLWVIDLSDPSDLRVSGEVEIPGWSTYLRPMGDRLLTLGVDDARGSRVAVQLFDVSNPAKPVLIGKVPLGENSSWSEANSDEKAFAVFPEDGLLLVPVSEWKEAGGVHGVQLLDFGRDTLSKRGFLKGESVVPRRATLFKERVLALSGRSLVGASIADRDEPVVTATLELAYPVERVVAIGGHLLEFRNGAVRVRNPSVQDSGAEVEIGDLPLLGAVHLGGRLHLLQGRGAEVLWDFDKVAESWNSRTNPGVMNASVWDVGSLPALKKLGETRWETSRQGFSDATAHVLDHGVLVWASAGQGGTPWFFGMGDVALPPLAGAAVGMVDSLRAAPGFWRPWWGVTSRTLMALRIQDGTPQFLSETTVGEGANAVGKVASAGSRVFATRQISESEVVGTNAVVESAWFPAPPRSETNIVLGTDGTTRTNILMTNEGEWRPVTNRYPILRWWSRHELDVVDYETDASAPVVRPAVAVPGALEGIDRGGALLLTSGWRTADPAASRVAWLDASAYDGVSAHLVHSVALAEEKASETYAVATRDGVAYVARGGWGPDARQRLEVWQLASDGRWARGAVAPLAVAPGELEWFGDVLLSRSAGELALFGVGAPGAIQVLPVAQTPGCFSGELGRGDGDSTKGVWLPLWEYGAVRVGP